MTSNKYHTFAALSDAERAPHYAAAGARPPSSLRIPVTHMSADHRALLTAARARRRMPRRGQTADNHIPREYRLGFRLWSLTVLYRDWLAGTLDAGLSHLINELLALTLGAAGSGCLYFIDGEADHRVAFDVCWDARAQLAALQALGWPAHPPYPVLVSHILDRLEWDWALRAADAEADDPSPAQLERREREEEIARAEFLEQHREDAAFDFGDNDLEELADLTLTEAALT